MHNKNRTRVRSLRRRCGKLLKCHIPSETKSTLYLLPRFQFLVTYTRNCLIINKLGENEVAVSEEQFEEYQGLRVERLNSIGAFSSLQNRSMSLESIPC